MGQILDEPIVTKETSVGKNDFLSWGCSSMQGFRVSMEDRHATETDRTITEKCSDFKVPSISFFAVFDGHSGQTAADFCSKELLKTVIEQEAKRLEKGGAKTVFDEDEKLVESYLSCDAGFEKKYERNPDSSGTTCISSILYREDDTFKIVCANVGDSRCVIFDDQKVTPLSFDHKPTNKEEMERIQKAGGYVEFGRVNGTLALSRAFGDITYKRNQNIGVREQCVIAVPGINRYTCNKESKGFSFMVLACDGIWDVMNNKTVCEFVEQRLKEMKDGTYDKQREERYYALYKRKQMQKELIMDKDQLKKKIKSGTYDLGRICEDLLDECVIELDSKDNVSVIIILLKEP